MLARQLQLDLFFIKSRRKLLLCAGSLLKSPKRLLRGNLGNADCPVLPDEGIGLDLIQAVAQYLIVRLRPFRSNGAFKDETRASGISI
jgi:hypothetical protein